MEIENLLAVLTPGLRSLAEDGRLAEAPAGGLDGAASLFVIDLEMSGPNPQMHEVLDIAGVRVTLAPGLPEEHSYGSRVKPRHIGNANPGALKVTGYSPKAWKDAIELHPAVHGFAKAGTGAVLTGWGIGQDVAFLLEVLRRAETPWPFAPVLLDIQPVARKLLAVGETVDRFNLGHVADRLGIGRMGEHGALADAYAAYDVLIKLLEGAR